MRAACSAVATCGRGYAGSPRAAGYTTKAMADHLADSRKKTTVIVQIEDVAALPNVADIAAVDGVDCLFIGRVDLAVAMGKGVSDAAVVDAVERMSTLRFMPAGDPGKRIGGATGPRNRKTHGICRCTACCFVAGS